MTRKTLLVMSGKGGVGKTTIAVNLALELSLRKCLTGLLDVDVHGPNALKMLGYENVKLEAEEKRLIPLQINDNLKAISLAGFIDDSSAVIWRGPRKHGLIRQLSDEVDWGNLEFLVVDFPPGTGDEHLSAVQLIKDIEGAIIISTPQQVSIMDMMRSVDFCTQLKVPIIGIIENMSGGIFGSGTVKQKCSENGLNFLGKIPLSEKISRSSDNGIPFINDPDYDININFKKIVDKIKKCR
ncbi:MAG: Mrp/NBP35 family ATP-binding protein [Candidatus Woesearchaeota archaeon]